MDWNNKGAFLKKSGDTLAKLFDKVKSLPDLELNTLEAEQTALIVIDMTNGFAREGALQSPRIEALIPGITELMGRLSGRQAPVVAFADNHTPASPEFEAYPPHCLKGTAESELVDEIKKAGDYLLIPKNSTNGFFEEDFSHWLKSHAHIENFILAGDCTDICVVQLATALKAWFNRQNKRVRVIVPERLVDTYDFELHDGDFMHLSALYTMIINGVEVVRNIK